VGKSFDVQDGFLRRIRVAQFARGITRVVLEVDDVSEYSAFLLPNPYRLIIDIHGRRGRSSKTAQKSAGKTGSLSARAKSLPDAPSVKTEQTPSSPVPERRR
jgi:N-acetylmuramoyl-L-alanine amidase